MPVNFSKIDKALMQLKNASELINLTELERDGLIQRFEYTIELLWKVSKKVLELNGVVAIAPKDVIREMANIGWIKKPEILIEFIKLRNELRHSYENEIAEKAYLEIKKFVPICEELLKILKEKSK